MNFHQKLVVYYILDYFGILLILDINFVLLEFILWDQRLSKELFVKNFEGLRYFKLIFSLSRILFKCFLLINFVNT